MEPMLAISKTEPGIGHIAVVEVEQPVPAPGQVLLRVLACGICGTDVHVYNWGNFAHRMQLPTVMGHEMCGVVEAVGAGVTRVAAGARVSVESHVACGRCYTCHRGWSHVCPNTRYPGIDFNGGFAPFTVLPEQIVWPVPDAISTEAAAMMEPFGIAVHASLEGSGVSGLNVLIAGCGPIGLMNIAAARALGANRIFATDVNAMRLHRALEMGADEVVDVSQEDAVQRIRASIRGRGVDVAIEYSARPESIAMAGKVLTPGGELRLLGVPSGEFLLDLDPWLFKGLIVRSLHGRRLFASWEHATNLLLDKKLGIETLVSDKLPLKEAGTGFDMAIAGSGVKIMFVCSE
jgi:threonine 3-dehydrogenase